jgi:hypothetical protein
MRALHIHRPAATGRKRDTGAEREPADVPRCPNCGAPLLASRRGGRRTLWCHCPVRRILALSASA